MEIFDYIINRTCDYSPEESLFYRDFFNKECDIALGACIIGASLHDKIPDDMNYVAVGSVSIMAADILVRAFLGNHGEKPVSGLIGLLRSLR